MTPHEQKIRNDVIEFATLLFGTGWREQLATKLGTCHRNLDHWMRADQPIPPAIVLGVINLMKTHMNDQRREQAELDKRLKELTMTIKTPARRSKVIEKSNWMEKSVPKFGAQLYVVEKEPVTA